MLNKKELYPAVEKVAPYIQKVNLLFVYKQIRICEGSFGHSVYRGCLVGVKLNLFLRKK
jgi:hypothetical protein